MTPRRDRRGMVLVVVAGVLALLLLAGVALLEMSQAAAAVSGAALSGCRASLAAESGMDYAAARLLLESGIPRFSTTPADRGDDWACRDGATTPLESARNPSYSHGEAWEDDPSVGADGIDNDDDGLIDERDATGRPTEGAGRREAHEPSGPGGRRGAFTARLRGKGLSFRLRIEPVGAKIPVNAGFLDLGNRNGGPTPPDHRDPALMHHAALLWILNNLGAIRISAGGTRRFDVPTSGEPIAASWLGFDLIQGRPPLGYRSPEDLRRRMLSLGYAAAEVEAVLPFLDAGPYEVQAESGMPTWSTSASVFPVPSIEYATAEPRVLQAVWMHLRTRMRGLPGEASAWAWYRDQGKVSARMGIRFADTCVPWSPVETLDPLGYPSPNGMLGVNRSYMTPVIFPDEALELASVAAGLREAGRYDPDLLHHAFIASASRPGSAFAKDVSSLDPETEPVARGAWIRAKADLAVLSVTPDQALAPGVGVWCSRGVAFDPAGTGAVPFSGVHPYYLSRVPYPSAPGASYASDRDPWQWGPTGTGSEGGRRIRSLTLTFGPATRFRVESMGLHGPGGALERRSCQIRALERLELTSQEDFEALGTPSSNPAWRVAPGAELAKRGILLDDPLPTGRRPIVPDPDASIGRSYPHLVTLPFPDPRSSTPSSAPFWPSFSRFYGAIALAGRENGALGAGLYWPVSHDYDGVAANDFDTDPPSGAPLTPTLPNDLAGVGAHCIAMPGTDSTCVQVPAPWSVDGGLIQDLTLELWTSPFFASANTEQILRMWDAASTGYIALTAVRTQVGTKAGTRFRLYVKWRNRIGQWVPMYWPPLLPPPEQQLDTWFMSTFIPDEQLAADGAGAYHLVLRLSRNETPGKTRFRLYVNGRPAPGYPAGTDLAPDGSSWPNGEMRSCAFLRFRCAHVDEIRMYPAQVAAEQNYRKGRFVPPPDAPELHPVPAYTSPRYVLDDPRSRLLSAQWLGLTSKGVKEKVDINVYLDAWDAQGEPVWRQLPLVQAGKVHPLPPDEIRSFRYTVVFFDPRPHDPTNDGPLWDTPLFESIAFAIRRPSRLPERSGWTR